MVTLPIATAIQRGAPKIKHVYYAFASYVRREGHLCEVFLVLAKMRLISEQMLRAVLK